MAPESHGEKKGWSGLFYLPNGLNFQFCWFNLIFLIAPSWSESSFILFLFFYLIRVGLSRSELIRPGLAAQVDPLRLLYLPILWYCSMLASFWKSKLCDFQNGQLLLISSCFSFSQYFQGGNFTSLLFPSSPLPFDWLQILDFFGIHGSCKSKTHLHTARCKEGQFCSLPFGQPVASMY